jgi:LuxR family maltose regulon positive regulatory protein
MDDLLLNTKVRVPSVAAGQVERPRLRAALERALDPGRCLLLVCAPAGFGKSTLLSGWAAGNSHATFAWLTLDAEDSDPIRFWTCVILALRQAYASFGEQALQALTAPRLLPASERSTLQSVLTVTLNGIAVLPGCPAIVLDDFHRVTSLEVHRQLSYALEHWPENARLVLSTRVDPPLPVARLRATGKMEEIRATDLRFSADESARFLEVNMEHPLGVEQAAVIEARTEGWIAGLKMAVLAARGAADVSSMVAGLSAGPPFILDYLAEEVLEQQDPLVQDFLVRTAILDRFCGTLGDVLTGRCDGQATLEEIRRRNLFLTPLDAVNTWFRYHPLFADLLRARLHRLHPQLPADLHLRASRWFEANDLPVEAFEHAQAAGDLPRAVDLVIAHSRRLTFSGRSATVERWLARMPEEVVRQDLRLLVSRCWTSCFTNRWHSLNEDLDRVKELLQVTAADDASPSSDLDHLIRANAATTVGILRVYVAYREGNLDSARELARHVMHLAPRMPPALHGAALTIQGFVLKESGELDQARDAFRQAGPLFLAENNLTAWALSVWQQVDVLVARGLLREAEEVSKGALGMLRSRECEHLPAASYVHVAVAEVAWMRNDLEQAKTSWLAASSTAGLTGDSELLLHIALGRSRFLTACGRFQEAFDILDSVEEDISHADNSAGFRLEIGAQRSIVWARAGRLHELLRWEQESRGIGGNGRAAELAAIARARALVVLDRPDEALELAALLLDGTCIGHGTGRSVTLLTIQALARWRRGEREAALGALRQALELAAPEGAIRLLLEEGEALGGPLAELRIRYGNTAASSGGRRAAVMDFLCRLQDTLDEAGAGNGASTAFEKHHLADGEHPPEAMTPREHEVLVLLAAGHTNKQIADRLFVSLATVKKHVSTVLEKLGAGNRTRAVALARRHGLL